MEQQIALTGNEKFDERPAPSPRSIGPGIVAAGALAVIGGALSTWATVGVPPTGTVQLAPSSVRGTTLVEGTVVLAFGAALLFGALATAFVRSHRVVPRAALVITSLGVLVISAYDGVRAAARMSSAGLDVTAHRVSSASGIPYEDLRARIASTIGDHVAVHMGSGLVLVLVGGAVAAFGAITVLRRPSVAS